MHTSTNSQRSGPPSPRMTRAGSATIAITAACGLAVAGPALAVPSTGGEGSVSNVSATWTPQLATGGTDGSVEQIRQLVPCGGTMYAVGRFSAIQQKRPALSTVTRNNAFSFSETTGAVTGWNPNVNGQVNSVALSADCSTAYIGGNFTSVNGAPVKNIAAVSTATGTVVPGFASTASARVNTLALVKGHLLVGGNFTSINGSTKDYFVSLNPATGRDDNYLNLNISGKYTYTDDGGQQSRGNSTHIFNSEVSPDGNKLLAMGVFTSVGGQARRQIFMLDLGSTSGTVNPWYSKDFDFNCHIVEPFYLQAAAWSPNGSKVYVATTGYKAANGMGYNTSEPRGNLGADATNICDAAAAYPSTPANVKHDWIDYTGCDSLYAVAADQVAVYTGGHQRWADSPQQCDGNGNGTRVDSPGLSGLFATGLNAGDSILRDMVPAPDGDLVNKYSKGRGLGAVDMIVTSAGLWIASDNAQNVDSCGKTSSGAIARGHKGLCFLPY